MSQVLGTEITEESVHSFLICKKCYRLFDEVDELEHRLLEIKVELVGNYKKSVDKSKEDKEQSEETEEKMETEENGTEKENNKQLRPKKILDIPSSDDENTEVMLFSCNIISDVHEVIKAHLWSLY